VHGVLRAKDGSLIRRTEVNRAAYAQNLRALARLQDEARAADLPFTLAVAPRRIDLCGDLLPTTYQLTREQSVWQQLDAAFPDACTLLHAAKSDHFYRTDHHWTADGAFFAYGQMGNALGFTPLSSSDFTRVCVSQSFFGTSDAAAGIPFTSPDELWLLLREDDSEYHATADGNPLPFAGFYDNSKLATRDKYAVFLGGNHALLSIERGVQDTRPTLLLIKDSFANAMIPFLARHFRILAVDPRYFQGELSPLAERADAMLLLCGMQTLTQSPLFSRLHVQ
jgi:hypothetical protein